MTPELETARVLLDATYEGLDLAGGDLAEATERPTASNASAWVEKGEWLALAKKVGAEKVFFVENNPVAVFAELGETNPSEWLDVFTRVWCMARPQLLFLAKEGDLSVYNLTRSPSRPMREVDEKSRKDRELHRQERLLDAVKTTAEVQTKLQKYRREQIESGQLFEDKRFGYDQRADHSLIRDLQKIRKALLDLKLGVEHAHSIIGRSIFIRYLEDRKVLTLDYFLSVAEGRPDWKKIIETVQPDAYLEEDERPIYPRVLADKDLTYALFEKLAVDFNGDMFPISVAEKNAVEPDHLELLQRLLLGTADDTLFFFAYRFDVIPIELISSIYEEFYSVQKKKKDNQGSHYTPSSLVEFVLSHTLNDELLNTQPRVMDPACGSGIFLVETFRRLVRHRMKQLNRRLRPIELRKILRDQIAGIDINPEAVRVAAFSLYLALLHYHEPPDILKNKLPNLTYEPREERDPNQHFDILVASNAFAVEDKIAEESILKLFGSACVDLVVGNPPWGNPLPADVHATRGKPGAIAWCKSRKRSVGDEELSQAFIHRILDLLKDGGKAGLLVSTGVFFKRLPPSQEFRKQWFEQAKLDQVVNFAAVRDTFFSGPSHKEGSIAPFASVIFQKTKPPRSSRFAYWSAKKTTFIERVQVVVLSRADVRLVRQERFLVNDELWKIYWWGSHRDEALIAALRLNSSLRELVGNDTKDLKLIGEGFTEAKEEKDASDWLLEFKELPTKLFVRYGPIDKTAFVSPPEEIKRKSSRTLYEGVRLLIKRGLSQKNKTNGKIIARLATDPFCFRNSIHGVRLQEEVAGNAEVLLGIVWSSLTRYYSFMTSGSWGMWHHEIHQEGIEKIPVRIPTDKRSRKRIVGVVKKLQAIDPDSYGLFHPEGLTEEQVKKTIRTLELELDDAIFDLFDLGDDEKDLIRDLCDVGLDLFYRGMKSQAVGPVVEKPSSFSGRRSDLKRSNADNQAIYDYIRVFLDVWEPELVERGGQFRWWVIRPADPSSMVAVVFSTESKDELLPDPVESLQDGWKRVLNRLSESSVQPFRAQRVFIDGMVRVISENDIALIKRNERRLWTRSSAREDAEATLLQVVRSQGITKPGGVEIVPAQPL